MKKLLFLLMLITTVVLPQQEGWNATITTTINEPNLVQLDIFSNKDGIHIVTQNQNSSNSLKYYLIKSSGEVISSSVIETQGGSQYSNIYGSNDHLYISYRLGTEIKTKRYNFTTGA